jgi:hypothetical protein
MKIVQWVLHKFVHMMWGSCMSLQEEETGIPVSRVGMYRLKCRRQQKTEDFYSRL